jgi:hypothetical protein
MADIQALANKRSRAIVACTQHPGFCPIEKAFKSPINNDFTLIHNAYYTPTQGQPRRIRLRTEFRTGLDPRWVEIPNGTIYLYSQDRPEVGVYEGAVIIIDTVHAGKYLADGTHKIALREQIVGYLRSIAANNAVIDQKELNRDPVAYEARQKVMKQGQLALERISAEGRTIYPLLPDRTERAEPEDKYRQEGDDWSKGEDNSTSLSARQRALPPHDPYLKEQINPAGFDSDSIRPSLIDPSSDQFPGPLDNYTSGPVHSGGPTLSDQHPDSDSSSDSKSSELQSGSAQHPGASQPPGNKKGR